MQKYALNMQKMLIFQNLPYTVVSRSLAQASIKWKTFLLGNYLEFWAIFVNLRLFWAKKWAIKQFSDN